MTTDHLILGGAAVVFLLALAYAVRNRNGNVRATIQSAAATLKPYAQAAEPSAAELLVKLHDKLDAEGKLTAALRTVGRLANSLADQHEAKMGETLGPKEPTATATPTPQGVKPIG